MLGSMNKLMAATAPFQPGFAVRLPLVIDVVPLLAEIDALGAEPWRVHFNTGYHDGGWSGVVLQSAGGNENTLHLGGAGSSGDSVQPTALSSGCPAIMRAITMFQCEVKAARLLRLAAGSTIREHHDADLIWGEGEARLHIPLLTHPDVAFYVADQRVQMVAGECWYLNLSLPHRVHNRSAQARVHLVLDCAVNDWLTDQLQRGAPPTLASLQTIDDATAQFQAFRETVFRDPTVRDQLRACGEMDEFMALAVMLGAAHGFMFSVEDVRAQVSRARRDWIEQWIV